MKCLTSHQYKVKRVGKETVHDGRIASFDALSCNLNWSDFGGNRTV